MKSSLFLAFALSAAMLAACETATPYQPLGAPNEHASGGYFERQIETDRWQVGFKGNDLTSRETVERYLLYRAAEVTLSHGGDWFETVQRATDKKVEGVTDYGGYDPYFGAYWGPSWGIYRRGFGWGGYGVWGDPAIFGPGIVTYDEIQRYEATAEIVIGHGPKPNDKQAFDARSVIEHLSGAVNPPHP